MFHGIRRRVSKLGFPAGRHRMGTGLTDTPCCETASGSPCREGEDDTGRRGCSFGEFVNEPAETARIDEFVRFLAVGEQRENPLTNLCNELLGLSAGHCRLHDERCSQIDKVSNFPHPGRFVIELFASDHGCFHPPVREG